MTTIKTPILICTVGLPYSGKKIWAKKQGLPIIDLEAIHEKQAKKEAETLKYIKQMIQSLFASGNQVVILLAENLTRKERVFWQDSTWNTQYREFKTTELEALRAAQAEGVTSKAILDQIKTKAKAYEPL